MNLANTSYNKKYRLNSNARPFSLNTEVPSNVMIAETTAATIVGRRYD